MISFKEFLKDQEARLRGEDASRDRLRQDWENAVYQLTQQMTAWLKESDPDRLVKLYEDTVVRDEGTTGRCHLVELQFWLGRQRVVISPVARDILGPRFRPFNDGNWSGRVDLVGDPNIYTLFRFSRDGQLDTWYLRDPRDLDLVPLSRETFDGALVDLFS